MRRTRRRLLEALMTLMTEKGYDAVTVQDVIDRADVSRSTFYAHFVSKDDLLANALDGFFLPLGTGSASIPHSEGGPLEFSLPLFRHAQANLRLYHTLVAKGGVALVERLASPILASRVRQDLDARMPTGRAMPVPVDIAVAYVVTAFLGLLKWWLEHDAPCDPEEMDRMLRALVLPSLAAIGISVQ